MWLVIIVIKPTTKVYEKYDAWQKYDIDFFFLTSLSLIIGNALQRHYIARKQMKLIHNTYL